MLSFCGIDVSFWPALARRITSPEQLITTADARAIILEHKDETTGAAHGNN